jgi:hypothetical protein
VWWLCGFLNDYVTTPTKIKQLGWCGFIISKINHHHHTTGVNTLQKTYKPFQKGNFKKQKLFPPKGREMRHIYNKTIF